MDDFLEHYNGLLRGIRDWPRWDSLCAQLSAAADDGWFVYYVGQETPSAPLPRDTFRRVLAEIDALLHRDHRESYLGIVYVDDFDAPRLIKIYDPNNLGSSCGSSGHQVQPGWVLSRMPPVPLGDVLLPESRKRWWRQLFAH